MSRRGGEMPWCSAVRPGLTLLPSISVSTTGRLSSCAQNKPLVRETLALRRVEGGDVIDSPLPAPGWLRPSKPGPGRVLAPA